MGDRVDKDTEIEVRNKIEMIVPSPRRAAGAVINKGFWIYGGFGIHGTTRPNDVGADLWVYRNGWKPICHQGPYAARYPSLCSVADGFYVFGGCSYDGDQVVFLNDLWFFNGSWIALARSKQDAPAGRYTSALALNGDKLFVFGGYSHKGVGEKIFWGDLWCFDLSRRCWGLMHDSQEGPGKRYGFGWTAVGPFLYIFGGFDGFKELDDFWMFDMDALSWQKLSQGGPKPRYCPALGIVSENIVLFGGRSKVNPKRNYSDTWIYNGTWSQLHTTTTSQQPGYHAKPAYASDGQSLWIFGGEGPNGHMSDLWRFEESGWRKIHGNRGDDPVLW